MSIRLRFVLIIGVISLVATVSMAVLSYRFTVNGSLEEARKKGDIVFSFIQASRMFVKNEQRPLMQSVIDKDRFYPTLMSGFAVTRGIWDEFSNISSDYRFKQATLDPLYAPNKADRDEVALIKTFNANATLKTQEGILEKDGANFFYSALPIKVEPNCLVCHGDPEDAPKDQLEIYGTTNGYNWTEGDVVSTFVTYVSIQKALDEARKSALILFSYGLSGIVILSLVIWFFFNKYLVKPISVLENRTTEISLGKNLDERIKIGSNDEIGALSRAIDRMRISTAKLLKMYKK